MNPVLVLIAAALFAGILFAIAIIALFAIWFVFTLGIAIGGTISDFNYNKKMLRNEAPYRLPWPYRFRGWQVGHCPDMHRCKTWMIFDDRVGKAFGIWRPVDRAY